MGEKFDPNFHQAMFEAPDTGQPDGTIVQILQAGYVIGDRLLRPAMVGVAKGGGPNPRRARQHSGHFRLMPLPRYAMPNFGAKFFIGHRPDGLRPEAAVPIYPSHSQGPGPGPAGHAS